jgi:CubicO group peptidase (beta-lactamase class C family)
MRSFHVAAVCGGLSLLPLNVTAQSFPSDGEVRSILQDRVDTDRAVGIVVGLLEPDGSTRVFAAGDAGADARALDGRSVFEIGSITKVFTGVLLADMARRGEVRLDDPVSQYLPEEVRVPSRGGREITLLDLSTHHSALPRLPSNLSPADASNPYADYTVEQMYAFLSGYELTRDIGAEFEYSNLAVGLLGHTLARAAETSYEELITERVLEPLGMESTGIALNGSMRDWLTQGHDATGAQASLWDIPTLAGAGALRSNTVDMLRFLSANVGDPRTELERAMRTAQEPRAQLPDGGPGSSVALNWIVRGTERGQIVWHNGGTGGFRTFIGFDPTRETGVVVLTNSGHGADDIGFHLLDPQLPLAEPEVPDEAGEEDRYRAALAWVDLIVAGEYAEAADQVNPAVAAQLDAARLESAWNQLAPQLGPLRSLEPKDQLLQQGFYVVVLTGTFEAGNFDVQVVLADDHTVAGFFVRPPS